MATKLSTWDKLSRALVDDGSGNFTLNTTPIAGGAPVGAATLLSAWDKLERALTDDGSGGYTLQTTGGGGGGGAAGTLTGTTLAANVVTSSLTAIGTLITPFRVSTNGDLSTGTGPAAALTGTWITGGSATTTKPYVLIEPTGTSSGGWGTTGTGLGVNAATGRIFDFQAAGVSIMRADSSGISALSAFVITGVPNANTLFVTQGVSTSGTRTAFVLNGGAHTGQAIAEENDVYFNLSRTVTFTTGAGTVAALRAVRIAPVTYAAGTAATTFTQAATFAVTGPPVASTNVVFTLPPVAIWCAGALRLDTNVANGTTAALFTAASAPAAANTAIQEWFVVYNNAGVARYIPSW